LLPSEEEIKVLTCEVFYLSRVEWAVTYVKLQLIQELAKILERIRLSSSGGLGPVDSKDSLLGANQIQSCFWGGSLGCEGPFGFERCGMGADGALDHRPARPEGLHWTG